MAGIGGRRSSSSRPRRALVGLLSGGLALGVLSAIPGGTARATGPYVSQGSETYVAVSSPPEIETVDSNTGAVVGSSIPLSETPTGLDEWYSNGDASSQLIVSETTGGSTTCSSTCDIQSVSLPSGTVTTKATVTYVPTQVVVSHYQPYALVLQPDGDQVKVYDIGDSTWTSQAVSLGLTAGDPMTISMNPDGEYAYVTDTADHEVVVLDDSGGTWSVGTTYTGSPSLFFPDDLTVSNGAGTGYVSDGENDSMKVFSLSGGGFSLTQTISLSAAPGPSAISSDDSTLFVGLPSADEVVAIDLSTDVRTYYPTSCGATSLLITHDDSELGLGCSSSSFSWLSAASGSVETTTGLDGAPAAAVDAARSSLHTFAFIALSGAGKVEYVDPASESSVG